MREYICKFCDKPINGGVTLLDGGISLHMHCKRLFEMKLRKAEIVKKWEASGLLDGLTGFAKPGLVKLFESEPNQVLNEVE